MTDWMIWGIAAGIVVILELFTGTFYLLMIAIGLGAGGLLGWAGIASTGQYVGAAVVGVAATYCLHRSKYGKIHKNDAARDPNVNMDIGQTIAISDWNNQPAGSYNARAMYRGAMWDVELAPGATPQPGTFIIRELRGSRLIVANSLTTAH